MLCLNTAVRSLLESLAPRRAWAAGNPIKRCAMRDSWDATVPAVFIADGAVYDTFVRGVV